MVWAGSGWALGQTVIRRYCSPLFGGSGGLGGGVWEASKPLMGGRGGGGTGGGSGLGQRRAWVVIRWDRLVVTVKYPPQLRLYVLGCHNSKKGIKDPSIK